MGLSPSEGRGGGTKLFRGEKGGGTKPFRGEEGDGGRRGMGLSPSEGRGVGLSPSEGRGVGLSPSEGRRGLGHTEAQNTEGVGKCSQ